MLFCVCPTSPSLCVSLCAFVLLPQPRPRVCAQELYHIGKTGDIILFARAGGSVSGPVIRGLLASDFDHVGILVKHKGEWGVLESVGETGVTVNELGSLINNGIKGSFKQCVLRQLHAPEELREEIETRALGFVASVYGLKFGLGNLVKFMVRKRSGSCHLPRFPSHSHATFCFFR